MKNKKPYTRPKITCSKLFLESGIAANSVPFSPMSPENQQNKKSESFESNGEFEIDWQVDL